MKIKEIFIAISITLALFLSFIFVISSSVEETNSEISSTDSSTNVDNNTDRNIVVDNGSSTTIEYSEKDLNDNINDYDTIIKLNNKSISANSNGVFINGTNVTITKAGKYLIEGTLDDGQIIINSAANGVVYLILSNVNIINSSGSAIYVEEAEKTVITLSGNNYLTDGKIYGNQTDGEPNATIFSKDDLTINGAGSLSIDANYEDGIVSKDDLKIVSGTIEINSVNDGIRGKNVVGIKKGDITIDAGGEGVKSTDDSDTSKGYIVIDGGNINIESDEDGIEAVTNIIINGGELNIVTGGGSSYDSTNNNWGVWGSSSSTSCKAIKADSIIIITGGNININSSDDAIHSNDEISISGGTINIKSGDDGIHSNSSLMLSGGTINIEKSYEGVESAEIVIEGGNIHVTSGDDGFNAAGGNDSSSVADRRGRNNFSNDTGSLTINGGYIVINSSGDGLDSNGSIDITDGIIIVNGPTNDGNGAIDANGTIIMDGGYLLAVGSAGMAETPDRTSSQYTVAITYATMQSSSLLIHIEDENGNSILTYQPSKKYQSVVLCSSELTKGKTYNVYNGGSSTGTQTDSLFEGGDYIGGEIVTNFTISSIVTNAGYTYNKIR